MARDPLAVLQRVRALQTLEAKRLLAERLGEQGFAEDERLRAESALHQEAEVGDPIAYAAWHPRGLAQIARARRAEKLAGDRLALARASLAEAMAAERLVEFAREQREAEIGRIEQKRLQAALDDASARSVAVCDNGDAA